MFNEHLLPNEALAAASWDLDHTILKNHVAQQLSEMKFNLEIKILQKQFLTFNFSDK